MRAAMPGDRESLLGKKRMLRDFIGPVHRGEAIVLTLKRSALDESVRQAVNHPG